MDTDSTFSEAQAGQGAQPSKQVVSGAASRSTAWPMQGGLQTITNSTSRTQIVAPSQSQASVSIKTESSLPLQDVRQAKTPSPKKVAPAPGKENETSTTPQSVD